MSKSNITDLEYSKIADYFNKPKWLDRVLKVGGFGAFCMLSIFIEWAPGILLGIAAIAIAIFMYNKKIKQAPTDKQIEQAWYKIAESRIPEAHRVANYDKEDCIRPTEYMFGYSSQFLENKEKKVVRGKDGFYRSNYRKLIYVVYGRDQIMTFEEGYCIENDVDGLDRVSEYFYADVSGVEIDQNTNSFLLKTSGGNVQFELTGEDGTHERHSIERAQDISNSIRAVLREKKSS